MRRLPFVKLWITEGFVLNAKKRKKRLKKKQHVAELKEVKLSVRIDVGDLNTKCKQTREFISAGNKVKVSVKFRGRELQHTELGFDVLDNFCNLCKEFAEKDGAPALEGRQVSVVLVKKGSKLLDKSKLAVKNKKDGSDLS
jgi:translation initiation factor IF-3